MKKIFSAGMFVLIYLAVYYVFQYTYIIVATTYYYVSDTKLQNLEVMDWLNNKLPSAIVFAARPTLNIIHNPPEEVSPIMFST